MKIFCQMPLMIDSTFILIHNTVMDLRTRLENELSLRTFNTQTTKKAHYTITMHKHLLNKP